MNFSNYRVNPLIQSDPTDTLRHCSHCLSTLSESVPHLSGTDTPPQAYQGLQAMIECIRLALDYESHRLQPPTSVDIL
jgi:hypothetical protein